MAPNPGNDPMPNIHIASLVDDLDTTAGKLSDVVTRLVEQFNLLGVWPGFDVPTENVPVSSASALDSLYLSARSAKSSVDRLEAIERSLRESLSKNTGPTSAVGRATPR